MDFGIFRDNWRRATDAMNLDSAERDVFNARCKTSLERLAARYRLFSVSAMLGGSSLTLLLLLIAPQTGISFPLWLLLCFEIYFLVCAVMDYWLYHGISELDLSAMTVEEVIRKSMYYRKRHLQFVCFLIPLALALIISMGVCADADTSYYGGMIVGGAFGLYMGTKAFRDFMRDYRDILK